MDQEIRNRIMATFLGRSILFIKREVARITAVVTTLAYYTRTNLDHSGGTLEINDKSHQDTRDRGLFSLFKEVVDIISSNGQKDINVVYHETLYNENKTDNMWTYYFHPIDNSTKEKFILFFTKRPYKDLLSSETINNLRLFNKIISTRIKIKEDIVAKANLFLEKNLKNKKFMAVHYRGTDVQKTISGYPGIFKKASIQSYFSEIDHALDRGYDSIFVATDEENILNIFLEKYGGRVIFYPSKKSINGQAIHKSENDRRQNGEDVIVEVLVMSMASFLLYGCSNVPTVVKYLNPQIPSKNLDLIKNS